MTVTSVKKDDERLTMTITADFDAPVERVFEASSADERLLLGVADQALLTLENERLVEELQGALDSVVACLGRALAVRRS